MPDAVEAQSPNHWKRQVLIAQSCPNLCNPMDCSQPGSTVHGILQARILDQVAIPFSRGIFPTQESNPGLLHYRRILYHLSHQGSPLDQWGSLYMFFTSISLIRLYASKGQELFSIEIYRWKRS